MFERRLYYHIDWALLIAVLALCALGVIMINSTTADPTRGTSRMYLTQLYAIVIGLGVMVFMLTLDYRTFTDKSHLIYFGLIALLLYVMFFGQVQMGARRWIPLKAFNLQPSEFAKVGVALVLAKFFGENRGSPSWTDLAIGGVLAAIPLGLIAKEPDLGTAVTSAYDRGAFAREIDYRRPPPPPRLGAEEAAWLDSLLQEKGLRSEGEEESGVSDGRT